MIHDEVRIEMSGHGHGHVFIDGEEMGGVRKVSFTSEVGEANRVTLEILAQRISVTAPAEVKKVHRQNVWQRMRALFRSML